MAMAAFYEVYEIGQLGNDVWTTKNEKNPTLRLREAERRFLQEHFIAIVAGRVCATMLIIIVLLCSLNARSMVANIVNYSIALMLVSLIFYAHDALRGGVNVLTFFGLMTFKYYAPILLFAGIHKLASLFVCLLMFAIPRTIEYSVTRCPVGPIVKITSDRHTFRVLYYCTVFLASCLWLLIGHYCGHTPLERTIVIICWINLYYLSYRIAAAVLNVLYFRV
jgi:hypothetical protein